MSNAWDDSIDETREVFWTSRIDVLFQYRFFKRVVGNKSILGSIFGIIDRFDMSMDGGDKKMPLWKFLLSSILNLLWLILGLVTLGLCWPLSLRRRILSAGM